MSLTLNLGVVDVPYADPPSKDGKAKPHNVTTGDVAGWLENKYHPVQIFYEQNAEKIAGYLSESLAGALESVLMGAPAESAAPFAAAETMIDNDFRQFLALGVMEQLGYPGVPTKAALEGRSSRLKKGRGARRPSFVDTGLYVQSFRTWFEGGVE